jgi:hypothetical protein
MMPTPQGKAHLYDPFRGLWLFYDPESVADVYWLAMVLIQNKLKQRAKEHSHLHVVTVGI